jgi:nitroimidazol reductase NimA-like FMN-containing flavoprotein (pyridoxamine 5'-phosphate oxidase superfamily)
MASSDDLEAFLAGQRNLIVAGIRADGRPHLTPNWFYWDGERFYVSTTRGRAKYAIFRRDTRAQLESLIAEGRVLLVITPDGPPPTWTSWGFD